MSIKRGLQEQDLARIRAVTSQPGYQEDLSRRVQEKFAASESAFAEDVEALRQARKFDAADLSFTVNI